MDTLKKNFNLSLKSFFFAQYLCLIILVSSGLTVIFGLNAKPGEYFFIQDLTPEHAVVLLTSTMVVVIGIMISAVNRIIINIGKKIFQEDSTNGSKEV